MSYTGTPIISTDVQWDTLYAEAAEGLDVLPTVEDATAWVNELVQRIAASID